MRANGPCSQRKQTDRCVMFTKLILRSLLVLTACHSITLGQRTAEMMGNIAFFEKSVRLTDAHGRIIPEIMA